MWIKYTWVNELIELESSQIKVFSRGVTRELASSGLFRSFCERAAVLFRTRDWNV